MKAETRNTVKKYLLNSYNQNERNYINGIYTQEVYDILLFLSDKLNFRSNSYWQEKLHKKYGFIGLVDRINKIRTFWDLPIMAMDYTYYNSKKQEVTA